ncbi:MAG: trypsin-like peptidase domain-containing protein [Lachnospiraceae bacterium]|nr:trypsin-like peptidase domain-containing protein [Lachnospiraceae bacterium]
MNEWEEDKKETGENGELPINGSDAVREANDLRAREEAEQAAEEARQREAAAAEARRLAEEHRQAVLAEQEDRKKRWEDYNRQKEAAEKARRKMKRRSFVSVLAALIAVAALAFGVTNYLSVKELKTQIASLQSQVTAAPGNTSRSSRGNQTADPGVLSEKAVLETVSAKESDGISGSLTDVSDIVSEVISSVVSIEVVSTVKVNSGFYGQREYEAQGAGSGVIIGGNETELWIATNYHVIEGAKEITIIFVDEETVSAYVKGSSQENDLAVLGIELSNIKEETKASIKAAVIGSSDDLKLGEGVIAIGNALGWGQSVTTGVVSGFERNVTFEDGTTMNLLQISAAINPGNSGGALLNAKGELIGINNAKYSDEDVEGIGFAIPISSIVDIMEELSLMEPRIPVAADQYPYLGITFDNRTSRYAEYYGIPAGAYVYEVGADTPAQKAGILAYDVITELDGVKISSYDDLVNELQYHAGGTEVTLKVKRLEKGSYQELEIRLTLGFKKDYN